MYKNVGGKIQTFAKILVWIGIVVFVLCAAVTLYGGLNTYNYEMIINGVVLLILGPIMCWVSSLTMVGFGKLVETNEEMKSEIEDLHRSVNEIKNK